MSVHEKMTAIADAIRARTGGTASLTLDEMAQEVDGVFAAGEQSEYDRFWDAYQQNGRRTDYSYAFSYGFWNEDSFRPKYDIRPTNPVGIFQNNEISDLGGHLRRNGVLLDTSQAKNINNMFYYSRIANVPPISAVGCTSAIVGTFAHSAVVSVEAFILKEDGSNTFNNTFGVCGGLKSINIVGTIGQNGFDVQTCPLNRESIESIINALSLATAGLSVTLRKTSVDTAFETGENAANGSVGAEWTALVNTKPNWNINLV